MTEKRCRGFGDGGTDIRDWTNVSMFSASALKSNEISVE